MNKKDEALKMALEAHTALREWVNAVPKETPLPAMPGMDGDWLNAVEATIREALAQQKGGGNLPPFLEQPEQEPEYKGWYCAHCQRGVDGSDVTYHEQHTVCGRVITDDVSPKAQQQEPVVEFMGRRKTPEGTRECWGILLCNFMQDPAIGTMLYTAPQPHKPLTIAQIDRAANNIITDDPVQWWRQFARAIEAAHGIKGDA